MRSDVVGCRHCASYRRNINSQPESAKSVSPPHNPHCKCFLYTFTLGVFHLIFSARSLARHPLLFCRLHYLYNFEMNVCLLSFCYHKTTFLCRARVVANVKLRPIMKEKFRKRRMKKTASRSTKMNHKMK